MIQFEYPWRVERANDLLTVKFDPEQLQQLGKLIFLDLPDSGSRLKKGMPCISVEATNWLGTCKIPVSGTVVAVNNQITGFKSHHIQPDEWLLQLRVT